MAEFDVLGRMNRQINNLQLKETPLDYDDTALRGLMAADKAEIMATLALMQIQIDNLIAFKAIYSELLQKVAAGQIGTTPDNVLVDDGA